MDLLSRLPVELLLQVSQLLHLSDLKSLSAATRRFRDQLAPSLYHTIRFTNRAKDEEDITRVVSRYGTNAHRLHFDFLLSPDVEAPGGDVSQVMPGTELPEFTSRLLQGETLPGVTEIKVKFIPSEAGYWGQQWGDREDMGCIYIFQDVVSPLRLESVEQEWPSWRRSLVKMWRVLSSNQNISALETLDLPPLPVSSWLHEDWSTFLGRLSALTLRIWGGDSGVGTKSITTGGYRDFLENLGTHFFEHAKGLKELHLVADERNFYGYNADYPSVTALREGQMPKLRELHVHHCFIDGALCDYLVGATDRQGLKRLHLVDCMGNEETPTWAELFSRLATTDTMGLVELVVSNKEVEFPFDHEFPEYLEPLAVRNEQYRSLFVRSNPDLDSEEKRPFAYGTVDDSEGTIYADEDRTAEEFESGEDMTAYRQLMEVVEENKKRSKDMSDV
ncbi:f-box-like domain-containing protein [Sarocladium implicatum]|nr:f-box-like domain-containing protein [Sarocladium implicatum]